MERTKKDEHDLECLHFPIDAVRERLQANVPDDVGPTAAVYCSAILQFLTSKVINEAVKFLEISDSDSDDQSPKSLKANRKRQRSDNEETASDTNNISNANEPPHKKRRICPKDITRALQTNPSLKEWADLIQIPYSNSNTHNTHNNTHNTQKFDKMESLNNKNNNNNNNCLDGVVIAFEGNFEICNTFYCEKLKKALEIQYIAQQKKENIYKHVLYENGNKNENKNKGESKMVLGDVLEDNLCSSLRKEFVSNPSLYSLTFLYHSATILSQQLHFSTCWRYNHNRFILLSRSPISCLSMAMLFMHKKYLTKLEFKLYLNSHQNELFPPCYRPDITIFIEHGPILDPVCDIDSIFSDSDRELMDDFLFELLIKRIASRKHGKYVFFKNKKKEIEVDMNVLSVNVMDVLLNRKKICRIYWESDLKAFNNIQNPNIVNPNKRIVYSEESQIIDGLKIMSRGELQQCDVVYIHISLWMKPKKQFKRLVMAHLCRFESICFYALRHPDLDDRAKQIVQWIFAK